MKTYCLTLLWALSFSSYKNVTVCSEIQPVCTQISVCSECLPSEVKMKSWAFQSTSKPLSWAFMYVSKFKLTLSRSLTPCRTVQISKQCAEQDFAGLLCICRWACPSPALSSMCSSWQEPRLGYTWACSSRFLGSQQLLSVQRASLQGLSTESRPGLSAGCAQHVKSPSVTQHLLPAGCRVSLCPDNRSGVPGQLLNVRLMAEFTLVLLSSDWVIGILVPSLCFSHISSHGNTGFPQTVKKERKGTWSRGFSQLCEKGRLCFTLGAIYSPGKIFHQGPLHLKLTF